MQSAEIIKKLDNIALSENITDTQAKELRDIIQYIEVNINIEKGKQIIYLVLKILTGFDDFPDIFN